MQDEFEWIESITPKQNHQPTLIEGIGDDAALIRSEAGFDDILCVDTLVENVHFSRKTMTPYQIGHKALAVNISDVAAMGGTPRFYLVSIAISDSWSETELQEIYKGMEGLADKYGIDLIGGDTVATKGPLVVSVTAHGRVQKGRKLLRKNAQPGDVVFLTGPVGLSAAGLELLLEDRLSENLTRLVDAHQLPAPQVEAGLLLAASGYKIALNDISDGLASESHEIAEASNVHIQIRYDQLPTVEEFNHFTSDQVLDWMLYGGEDFQLVGTVPLEDWASLVQLFGEHGLAIHEIGAVVEGKAGVSLFKDHETIPVSKKGYNHFSG
ncbi:thiamine-phosphate kinase [Pseudalkalibacillus salsuginis]|uniref:thiamine-phosphate kinase n=1 Tax=Pseudalkalibacillus salsuginis TaxID=2910972 RepID=UPI001F2C5137|nr:thiamine-phosphate kinase [Pseudalkalibacillus salsuginis]MCF6411479.1 thiamine-phosphate kinase [Pseudalkalibacillus salsuginis]